MKRDENVVNKLAENMDMLVEDGTRRKNMEQAVLVKTEDWTTEKFYEDFCEIITEV